MDAPLDISGNVIAIERNEQAKIVLRKAVEQFIKKPEILFVRDIAAGIEKMKSLAEYNKVITIISDIYYNDACNIHTLIHTMEAIPSLWNIPLIIYTNENSVEMLNKVRKDIEHIPCRIIRKNSDHVAIAKTCILLLKFKKENEHYLEIEKNIGSYLKLGKPSLLLSLIAKIDETAIKHPKAFPMVRMNLLKGKVYYELWKAKKAESNKLLNEIEKYSMEDPKALDKVKNFEAITADLENYISMAEEYFNVVYAAFPKYWNNLHMLFKLHLDKNDLGKAKEYLAKLIDIFPDQTEYYLQMGKINEIEGDLSNAVKNYFKAANSQMDEGLDSVNSSDIMEIVNKVLGASKRIMEKFGITNLAPSKQTQDNIDSVPMLTLQKVNALARNAINHLIKHNPEDATLYNKIGLTYRRSGDTQSALQMYKKAIDIDPKDHRIRVNYAVANALLGSWDLALKEVEKALELDSDNYDKYIIQSLLDIIGKKDKDKLEKILI